MLGDGTQKVSSHLQSETCRNTHRLQGGKILLRLRPVELYLGARVNRLARSDEPCLLKKDDRRRG